MWNKQSQRLLIYFTCKTLTTWLFGPYLKNLKFQQFAYILRQRFKHGSKLDCFVWSFYQRKQDHSCCVSRNTFFSRFQPFLFILNFFQWFHGWNQQKTSENEQKNVVLSTLQSWLTCKSWSTPWGGTSELSFLLILQHTPYTFSK